MVRIVNFNKIGGPEVLQFKDIEPPPPSSGEVRFNVKAIGLNRAEALFRSGKYLMPPKFPSRLGYEASGVVDAVGPDVKGIIPGDVISVVPPLDQGKYGVYGETATVPEYFVVKHPPSISFADAAAIWMQYMTAYGALIDIAAIKKEDYVVIPAASSSVGLAAIQLCNMVGAVPIAATRKEDKKTALLNAGAAHVIVTQKEHVGARMNEITGGKGARVVFDPVGGKTVLDLAQGMAQGGILFQYGGLSFEQTPFPFKDALMKGLTMRGYTLFEIVSDPARFEKAKLFILDALSFGNIKPIIAKTFPLDEIIEAHRYMESNEQIGKIIVTVNNN